MKIFEASYLKLPHFSCQSIFQCTEVLTDHTNVPLSYCYVFSDCSWVTSRVKGSEAILVVILQISMSVLSQNLKISFLSRKIHSVAKLTKTNGKIVFTCLVTI